MFQIKTTYNSGFYDTKMGGNRLNSASAGFSNMLNKQSPKILSGKLREQKLPFSIADVPVTKIANGTCLPAQYLRREDNEKEILTNKTTTKSSDTKSITKLELSSREDAVRRNVKDKTHSPPKDNVITEKYFEIKERRFKERNIHTADNKIRTKNFIEGNDKWMTSNFLGSNSNDRWMPPNFKEYERQIKTACSNRENYLPKVSVKEVKEKMLESDIFFLKKNDYTTENFEKTREKSQKSKGFDYLESDIFNKKKSSKKESHTNEKIKTNNYCVTTNSNSQWHAKNSNASLLNHCSTEFHILNPGIKHITKTKENILENSKNFNPTYRQKSICEFIDLSRVGVPNPNKEFLLALNKSKTAFFRESQLCANYIDMYKSYRNLSDKPFSKKFI